ncbi:hypothetical protein, partial [Priestia megaterium]|uniref:hypothetical protein n=1 Tax=Priestia megaterium TaxID=1404 RepID=UPI0035B64995
QDGGGQNNRRDGGQQLGFHSRPLIDALGGAFARQIAEVSMPAACAKVDAAGEPQRYAHSGAGVQGSA